MRISPCTSYDWNPPSLFVPMYAYFGVSWRSRSQVPNFEPSCRMMSEISGGTSARGTYTRLLVQGFNDKHEGRASNFTDRLGRFSTMMQCARLITHLFVHEIERRLVDEADVETFLSAT